MEDTPESPQSKSLLPQGNPETSALALHGLVLPTLVTQAGPTASRRFLEFLVATIRNPNTRAAYARALGQFLNWCEARGIPHLDRIQPLHVAAYLEQHPGSPPTIKQHLAAIRMLFDFWVIGQVLPVNPAGSVRGPKYVTKRGKTPVLEAAEARTLLDSIETSSVLGLRDRALIALMCYTFARVSAVVHMRLEDYYESGRRRWFRLHEKGGKRHEVPAHHNAQTYLEDYLAAAQLTDPKGFLFCTLDRSRTLTNRPMSRIDVFRMIKRRSALAKLPSSTNCHTFRATGITAYLKNGGSLEHAQLIAAHESPRTTKLYDRTSDAIRLDEIERIHI